MPRGSLSIEPVCARLYIHGVDVMVVASDTAFAASD